MRRTSRSSSPRPDRTVPARPGWPRSRRAAAARGRVRRVRRAGRRIAGGVPRLRVIVGGMQDVFAYIDQHRDRFIERLQWLCRQPSIAAQNVGIQETAQMVAQLMREVGVTPALYATDGAPVVYGTAGAPGGAPLIANHNTSPPPRPLAAVGAAR